MCQTISLDLLVVFTESALTLWVILQFTAVKCEVFIYFNVFLMMFGSSPPQCFTV